MIRRHAGDLFHLITPHDHALLSGKLAAHFGNPRFAPLEPRDQTVAAASLAALPQTIQAALHPDSTHDLLISADPYHTLFPWESLKYSAAPDALNSLLQSPPLAWPPPSSTSAASSNAPPANPTPLSGPPGLS